MSQFERFLVAVLLVLVALLALTFTVRAHSWYDQACCHDRDCAPIPEPRKVKGGYMHGQFFFPTKLLRYSKDGRWHACIMGQTPLCLYAPFGM